MNLWTRPLREYSDVELNLIPLIDIMSVMVAFLLIYSADVEIVQNTKGVEIPYSSAKVQPQQSVVVMLTKEHLFVQGELVSSIGEIRAGEEPVVEPLRLVLERPMHNQDAAQSDPALLAREITVIADKTIPFDVVRKVMATCTASAYEKVSLAVLEKEKPLYAAG